jgi:ribosomal protein L21E
VKGQPFSPFHGKIGVVVRSSAYGLAVIYEVAFEQFMAHISSANKFF